MFEPLRGMTAALKGPRTSSRTSNLTAEGDLGMIFEDVEDAEGKRKPNRPRNWMQAMFLKVSDVFTFDCVVSQSPRNGKICEELPF